MRPPSPGQRLPSRARPSRRQSSCLLRRPHEPNCRHNEREAPRLDYLGSVTYLAVDLEPDVTLRTALDDWANRHETDDERLALLDGDMHLLADFGATKEVAGRDHTGRQNQHSGGDTQAARHTSGHRISQRSPGSPRTPDHDGHSTCRPPCGVWHATHLRVHDVRRDIRIRDVLAKLAAQLRLRLLEVNRWQVGAWPAIDPGLVPDDLRPEWLREASDGLTKVPLEELDDRRGEVELVRALEHLFLRELVGYHPLREVTDDLRRGSDLARRQLQLQRS